MLPCLWAGWGGQIKCRLLISEGNVYQPGHVLELWLFQSRCGSNLRKNPFQIDAETAMMKSLAMNISDANTDLPSFKIKNSAPLAGCCLLACELTMMKQMHSWWPSCCMLVLPCCESLSHVKFPMTHAIMGNGDVTLLSPSEMVEPTFYSFTDNIFAHLRPTVWILCCEKMRARQDARVRLLYVKRATYSSTSNTPTPTSNGSRGHLNWRSFY